MTPRLTLINRDYTRLWFGQAVSSVGDAVFSTTLVLWVATVLAKDESWAPMAVSGVLMASSVAVLVIGPLAGVFVDRWDKLATLLRTEVVRGALVVVLTVVSFLPTDALPAGVWLALVYVTVLLLHAAGQFFSPARFAILADLVKGDADRARAAGIGQATGETAWIIGPPLAAPLLFAAGIQWALLFNALSYAVSYVAIRSIDVPASAATAARRRPASERTPNDAKPAGLKPSLGREFADGVRFFARSRFLVVLLLLAVIGQFGLGALSTLNVFFTTDNLNADAHLYGYIGMAMGVGGITGALSGGRVVQWLGARRSTWISLLVSGVLLIAYSRQTTFLGGVALLFVFTVPLTVLNTAMAPLLLAAAPPDLRGRVMAVFYPVTKLASMLAAVLSGWLAGSVLTDVAGSVGGVRFGPIDTIFAVSGVIVVLSGVFAWLALPGTGNAGKEAGEDVAGGPGEATAKRPGRTGGERAGEATETGARNGAESGAGPGAPLDARTGSGKPAGQAGGTAAEKAVALTVDVTSPAGTRGHRPPDHERGRPE
ncbi:MFS transporter [Streptomyces sp. NPDC088707]|uniref:MFS transporter n=1 Tax=Streptomyces sp. NPDC088707 TaxID=3365871 RepID=UPI0038200A9F